MKYILWIVIVSSALVAVEMSTPAAAVERMVCRNSQHCPWHGNYYHVAWGMPVALVVPPTAENETNWGWGVGNTRVTPICPQFGRAWPGPGHYDCRQFKSLPHWPSDTNQYGVYYVRGPW